MSEFHPNRQKLVRTKPGLTARRVLEMWPILVWGGVLALAVFAFQTGVNFNRMNGSVNVSQEFIAPAEDGRVLRVADENGQPLQIGQRVSAGQVVAHMDDRVYRDQIIAVFQHATRERDDAVRDIDRDLPDYDKQLNEVDLKYAEYAKEKADIQARLDMIPGDGIARRNLLAQVKSMDEILSTLDTNRKRSNDAKDARLKDREELLKSRDTIREITSKISTAAKFSEIIALEGLFLPSLRAQDHDEYFALRSSIENCYLRSATGGIVSRIEKENGSFCQAGYPVLRVVADPSKLICFLPQDQIGNMKVGETVYASPSYNKEIVYPVKILAISPRIDAIPDTASPLPNKFMHGQYVDLEYPAEARLPNKTYALIPGETIIVTRNIPGKIGPLEWINRIFWSDTRE